MVLAKYSTGQEFEGRGHHVSFSSVRLPVVLWESDRRSDVVPSLAGPRALTLTKYVPIPRSKDPLGTLPDS
jgi:hypothetical protein